MATSLRLAITGRMRWEGEAGGGSPPLSLPALSSGPQWTTHKDVGGKVRNVLSLESPF